MSFTLGPDGTPIRKRDLSDWSVAEDSKITAMFCDPETGNIYVAKKEPPLATPTLSGPWIGSSIPAQIVKTFPDLTKISVINQGSDLKAVIRFPTPVSLSERYIEGNLDMIESKTISKAALAKWTTTSSTGSYIASDPNSNTRSRVSIWKYNAQKQLIGEIWSGQSPFAINGLCVSKGLLFYTHESEVRTIDPTGQPYRVAGTPYVLNGTQNFSSTPLQDPTTYARTFRLGNPYGITYDKSTDLIFFTDVEQAAVYSLNVDTGILSKICTGSLDIVSQISDIERPSTDCYIQDPAGISCAADGTIYVSAVTSGQIYKLRKSYDSDGTLQYFISIFAGYNSQATTLASEDDRPAKYARIQNPLCLAVDTRMNVYYSEQAPNIPTRIRYIQPDIYRTYFKGRTGAFNYWPLQVIMNNSPEGYTREEPPAGSDSINAAAISFEFYANHLAADEEGNVYFCDPKYGTLNRVTTNNEIQVIAAGIPNLYSVTIINNTDAWVCTLDMKTTTANSTLYRIPFIQNPSWPITPDITIPLDTRIECIASHPRGYIFMAGKSDLGIYTYDIASQTLYVTSAGFSIASMCLGMNNTILYASSTTTPVDTTGTTTATTTPTNVSNIYAYTIDSLTKPITRKITFRTPPWPQPTMTTNVADDYWYFEFKTPDGGALIHAQVRFYLENGVQNVIFQPRTDGGVWLFSSAVSFPISDFGITRAGGQTLTIEYDGRTFTITSDATPSVKKTYTPPTSSFPTIVDISTISFISRPQITFTSDVTSATLSRSQIAGNGTNLYTPAVLDDTSTPTAAALPNPRGIAYNSAEKCLYVTCGINDQTTPKFVRRIDLSTDGRSGIFATTLIGSKRPGFPLSGASYSSVSLMYPTGIVCTLQGSIYCIDTMYPTDLIQATSVLIRVPNLFFLKPDLMYAFAGSGIPGTAAPVDGTLTQRVSLSTINGLTLDRDGNVYFTTNWNTIHMVDALTYKITKIAGTGVNPGTAARTDGISAVTAPLDTPRGLVYSRSGILYFTEGKYIRYLEKDATGAYLIKTLAGNGTTTYNTAGANVENIDLEISPGSATLWIDPITNILYVSIKNNFRIYSIDTFKRLNLITNMSSIGTSTSDIHSICKYGNYIYMCVPYKNTIYRIDLGNTNTTGNFVAYISSAASGTAANWIDAGLSSPYGIVLDKKGTLYVSMTARHTIKRYSVVSPTGNPILDTGSPYIGIDGLRSYGDGEAISGIIDGMRGKDSRLHSPTLLTLDVYNRLFFVDQGKNRICCLATGVDLDTRGVPTNFIRIESAGPGRTFFISQFDVYRLEERVYSGINSGDIPQQALRSIDIQLNKTDTTSIVITYINIRVNTADSLDTKVYLYNQFREIMAVQTITAEALKPEGQNLIFIESWSQENVPAIRNQLANRARGIENVASVGLIDTNGTIDNFVIVTATSDDKIMTYTQRADSARWVTDTNGNRTPAIIEYKSSDTTQPYKIEVLCVFLMRKPGVRSTQLNSDINTFPVQVILKDRSGTMLKHKKLVIATPNNIKYEVVDFRLNSELYSTLSMDAIYEAVFGVKRVRYVRIFFSETGSTGVTATKDVKIRTISVVSVENGTNVAFRKPVYDSAGNSYASLTDESNTALGTLGTSITWLEVDLQYPAMIDRVMINRAEDDSMEYFIQGYTERRELVLFPTSAENPFSQKTSVVYVSGSGYNATAGRNRYLTESQSGMSYYSPTEAMTNGPRLSQFSGKACSQKSYSKYTGSDQFGSKYAYMCVEILNNFVMIESRLQIQKLFAYPSQTSTTDIMVSSNVTLRSSAPDNTALNTPDKALTDEPSFNSTASLTDTSIFITAGRTNNEYWEATYTTPTYIKKFRLKQDPNDPAAKVRMFGINLRHYNQKRRLLGRYGARGNYDTEDFTYSQSPLNTYQIPMLIFKRGVPNVRYVRMTNLSQNAADRLVQISQLCVYDTQGNLVSLNKPILTTTNFASLPTNWNTFLNINKDWVTQGHMYPSMYTMYHSDNVTSSLVIDLGADFTGEIESVVYYNRCGHLDANNPNTFDQIVGFDVTYRAAGQQIQLLSKDITDPLSTSITPLASRTLKGSLLRESLDFRPAADDQTQYVRARYVRIENPGPIASGTYAPTTMTFSSLKINDIYGINVTYGKSVNAENFTATDDSGGGELTADKYRPIQTEPSNYTIGSIPGSYWEIDLGEEISIASVEFQITNITEFKNAPLNFYDEDRSLIAQYFMDPKTNLYEFKLLDAVNPTFPSVSTRQVRFVQILGNRPPATDRLRFGQLIVLDRNGVNIALGKPTYSSQAYLDSAAAKTRYSHYAVNGRCTNWFESAPTPESNTNSGHAYLEVDLGGTYDVCAIILRDFYNVRGIQTFGDININTEGRANGELNAGSLTNGTEYKIVVGSSTTPPNPIPRTGIGKKARYVRLRQAPLPTATNRGENGIALSQVVIVDAIGRNVALGKPAIAYPDVTGKEKIVSGFYNANASSTTSIWKSDANWDATTASKLDTTWIEIDLGAEYWITEVILHDVTGNTYSQANYDVIMRDTYYTMVYYGQGVLTAASRSLNILHKRLTNSVKTCPANSRKGTGGGGTDSTKCYVDCAADDVMAGDIRGTTTTITSNLNCYTACPNQQGLGSVSVLDSTGIFSLCSACPSNSTYDLIKNKCITDCPSNYEPRENTNGMFCSKYCTMDPSGNPMTWADPVTKTECRTANFPGTSGETRLIVDSNAIKTMSYTSSMQFTSNKPFGVAIIKSMDVFTNFWRNPNINVIDYRKMGEYQTSGRARLLFQYFYDNTSNLRSTTQSSGIVNRTSINLITTSRPTTQKRIVPMTIDPTNTDGGYLYINRTGTQRRYQIYLDWTDMTDTTKRFYADTSNPVYVYGRSYSQSISLGTARTSAPVFPLPTNPFDQGSCPPGYTDLGTSVANPCKQNKPTDATEVGSNYIQNCPAGYTAISDTQCKRDCTGLYEVHNDNQCRIRPPTTNYALSEDGTKWILCSGNDPNNIPYKYENNSGKYVFNSLCYEQNNPSIPTGEKMNVQPEQIGYNFSPFDRGLWEWYYNWRWVEQWQGFNNANTFVNGTYSRLPGCSNQCVTQKPPNAATQQDIWPYFVHTYASFNGNWGRLPSERWAWVSDTDARAVNGGLLYDRGIETDGRNSWRNNRGHWSYRNIFFDGQNNNGPMNRYLRENKSRWIYTKTPDDIQNVTYIPRDLLNRVSNPIDYVPRV